jgi:hypothetical protein
LGNDGIIIDTVDENNSQLHHLSINNDNVVAMKILEIENFRCSFLSLLNKVKDLKEGHSAKDGPNRDIQNFLWHMVTMFRPVLNSYIVYAILDWPYNIGDKVYARKLLNLIVSNMTDLIFQMSELFKFKINFLHFQHATGGFIRSPLVRNFVRNSFLLDPDFLMDVYRQSKKLNLRKDSIDLINNAWKISFKIYPYTILGPSIKDRHLFKEAPKKSEEDEGKIDLLQELENDWRLSLLIHKDKVKRTGNEFELDDVLEPV